MRQKLVSKGNSKNFYAYLKDWTIREVIKVGGFFYLAKLGEDLKLIPQWEHLKKKDFILVE